MSRNSSHLKSSLANAALYQIGWFACVIGAAWDRGTAGALLAVSLAGLHLVLAERPDREWPLMLLAAGLGLAIETVHLSLGVLEYRGHVPGTLAPLWIVALWLQFATVFHFCLSWLSRRYWLAAVTGLLGGPLAFVAGERLGAATFGEPRLLALVIVGLAWAWVLPLLVWLADRLGGVGRYRLPYVRQEVEA